MISQVSTIAVFFDDALNEAITESLKTAQPVSLAMVDFDRFGTLNKEYGEDVGDAVLLAAASIFREVFDESDILVRYGGDEFAFILPGKDGETALNRCQQVEDSLRKIDLLEGKKGSLKHVSASIGIAVCPAHGQKAGDLLGNADKALYAAKEAGRAQAALYGARRYKSKNPHTESAESKRAF